MLIFALKCVCKFALVNHKIFKLIMTNLTGLFLYNLYFKLLFKDFLNFYLIKAIAIFLHLECFKMFFLTFILFFNIKLVYFGVGRI